MENAASFAPLLSKLNGENLEIVRAITTLAHSLNMHVVAEGVETENQLTQLKALKCEYMQGYYFSKPLDSKEVETLLQQSRSNLIHYSAHSSSQS